MKFEEPNSILSCLAVWRWAELSAKWKVHCFFVCLFFLFGFFLLCRWHELDTLMCVEGFVSGGGLWLYGWCLGGGGIALWKRVLTLPQRLQILTELFPENGYCRQNYIVNVAYHKLNKRLNLYYHLTLVTTNDPAINVSTCTLTICNIRLKVSGQSVTLTCQIQSLHYICILPITADKIPDIYGQRS